MATSEYPLHKCDIYSHQGRWAVRCPMCGMVTEQQHEADAESIAARHAEVGGFERP